MNIIYNIYMYGVELRLRPNCISIMFIGGSNLKNACI